EATLRKVREQARNEGTLGYRLYAEQGDVGRIPFADGYVNVVLITDMTDRALDATRVDEIVRVLAPQTGMALVGLSKGSDGALTKSKLEVWALSSGIEDVRIEQNDLGLFACIRKPPLPGAADWTHRLYDSANHSLSPDTACAWPVMTQWLGRPLLTQEPLQIAAGGRVASVYLRGWGNESLLAVRDLNNGRLLWHRMLDKTALATRTSAIAMFPSDLYIAEKDEVLILDPATGEQKDAISCSELGEQVKWFAIADGRLHVMAGDAEPQVMAHQTWKFFGLDQAKLKAMGLGNSLGVYDLGSKTWLWRKTFEKNTLDEGYLCLKDDSLYLLVHSKHLACLCATDGEERWTNAAVAKAVDAFLWADLRGHIGALMATDKYLGIIQPGRGALVMSRHDGSILWQPTATSMMFKGDLVLSKGDWRRKTPAVTVASTGQAADVLEDLFLGSGCGAFSMTPNLFCGQLGITYDFLNDRSLVVNRVSSMSHKTSCLCPPFVADGRVVYGTVSCVCRFPVRGTIVQAPAAALASAEELAAPERLSHTPGFDKCAGLEVTNKDWPTFRADASRSNACRAKVPSQASVRWTFYPEKRITPDLKLPAVNGPENAYTPGDPFAATPETVQAVAAGSLVFVADLDGTVTALDLAGGTMKWRYFTAARLYSSPCVADGRVYIGSGDGRITCLEAISGRELWKYDVAPIQRRIMVYGDLVNTWPITGGVIVHEGTVYAAAGMLNIDGTSVVALDARTGAVKWRNDSSGHLDPDTRMGVSAVGVPAIARDRLWIRASSYDLATGECRAFPEATLADDSIAANAMLNKYTGFLGDKYLVRGGRRYFDDPPSTENRATFPLAFLELTPEGLANGPDIQVWAACRIMPAWDARHLLAFPQSTQQKRGEHREDLICRDMAKTLAELAEKGKAERKPGQRTTLPMVAGLDPNRANNERFEAAAQAWTREYPFIRAAVLAENAAIAAHIEPGTRKSNGDPVPPSKHLLTAFNRDRGNIVWEVELPGEPIADGVSIARDGSVLVRLLDGGLVSVGPK
ncbi:MAG TPA: PQQ-binding-like beta-propeller repeat protein, partial [Thermoguttaceae bacterium]|nr:PQQ-binding-like beta-propeller repeat protein [Thermoguttaceae bacterium]